MKIIAFFMFLVLSASAYAGDRASDGMISIKKFEIAPPASGTYAPWRDRNDSLKWHAGQLITVSGPTFRYVFFSDAIDPDRPQPDYPGKISIFKDHVFLDHPGVPFPYRISGLADGVPVVLTWEGYEQWKKKKKVSGADLLYLEKTPAKEK